MFSVTHQVHSYGTRSSEVFHLPHCKTNLRKFSISFQGPKFFNCLSSEIRYATSTASFCCKLKAFLLSYLSLSLSLSLFFYPNYNHYDYLIYLKILQ